MPHLTPRDLKRAASEAALMLTLEVPACLRDSELTDEIERLVMEGIEKGASGLRSPAANYFEAKSRAKRIGLAYAQPRLYRALARMYEVLATEDQRMSDAGPVAR